MELELIGFTQDQKMQREIKIREYRSDLDEAKRGFLKFQDRYIQAKNRDTLMGANLEEHVLFWF